MDLHFFHDSFDMVLNGIHTDSQGKGDFFVRESISNIVNDCSLAWGEVDCRRQRGCTKDGTRQVLDQNHDQGLCSRSV